jgi:hypothetical protein
LITNRRGCTKILLNSRFAYVSISRASHETTLFTDDMAKLGPQLGADVSKTSALEITLRFIPRAGNRDRALTRYIRYG